MLKNLTLALLAVTSVLALAGTADAFWWRRARVFERPMMVPAAPQTVDGQTYRSYSYEPAAPATRTYSAPSRGGSGYSGWNFDAGKKMKGF